MEPTIDEVMHEINTLVLDYDFPLTVLQDVDKRLSDCREVGYAQQQLRYLTNLVNRGLAIKKG